MFRRLAARSSNENSEDLEIGKPTLMDKRTMGMRDFASNSDDSPRIVGKHVGTINGPRSGEKPRYPPRPPRKVTANAPAPILIINNTSDNPPPLPEKPHNYRAKKKYRPASSVYSQPSPPPVPGFESKPAFKQTRDSPQTSRYYHDVFEAAHSNSSHIAQYPVAFGGLGSSPIEEMSFSSPDYPAPLKYTKPTSSNGTVRVEHRAGVAAIAANLLSKQNENGVNKRQFGENPRWDPLTGEPTKGARGKPSQVKLKEFSPPTSPSGYVPYKPSAGRVEVSPSQGFFSQRLRGMASPQQWKSSSGREKALPQLIDRPTITPLNIPRKVPSQRGFSSGSSGNESPASGTISPISETSSVSPPLSSRARFANKPLPRTFDDPTTPDSVSPISFAAPHVRVESYGYSSDDRFGQDLQDSSSETIKPIEVKPYIPPTRTVPPSTSQIERNFDSALNNIGQARYKLPVEVSRFSATTYNSSGSDTTPRPSIDRSIQRPFQPRPYTDEASSVLARRRPRLNSVDAPMPPSPSRKTVNRKPMSNEAVQRLNSMSSQYASSTFSTSTTNTSKMLPPPPPVEESVDLISNLEARIADLSRRRTNLDKSIFQMTQLMPHAGVLGQERERRREEERKVRILEEDLLEVKKEEHELGLKLHRAWKREANEANYEPTSLWVRRVTG